MNNSDLHNETIEAEKKALILECQWNKNHNVPSDTGYDCDNCKDRFTCYYLKAKKFGITESCIRSAVGVVFAEDRRTAQDLFFEYRHENDTIVKDFDEEEDGCDCDVLEITEGNK